MISVLRQPTSHRVSHRALALLACVLGALVIESAAAGIKEGDPTSSPIPNRWVRSSRSRTTDRFISSSFTACARQVRGRRQSFAKVFVNM
jgi:hypothetical protein